MIDLEAGLFSRQALSPQNAGMSTASIIKTYGMSERADHLDFDIRSQLVRPPLVRPHRHEYFQIQISLQGDTEQNVAG